MKNCNIITLLFSLFFTVTGISQDKIIDSLEHELIVHKQKDTIRVNILDRLAFLYYRKDIDKAIEYIEKTEALSNELNFIKGKGNAIYMRGVVQIVQSNFDLAIEHFENALKIFSANGFKKNMASCYNSIGIIHYYRSDYEPALFYFKKALQCDEEVGIKRNIPNYVTNIGNINIKTGNYAEAIQYFQKGLKLYKENNNKLGISASLRKMAVVYKNNGNYPLALEYQNKALVLSEEIQDSTGISISLNSLGLLYKKQEKYDKALTLLNKALDFQEKTKNKKNIAAIKNSIASVYIKKKAYSNATKFLNESLVINRKINAKSQMAECLNNLGCVQGLLKKHTLAFQFFEEAKNINTEIENKKGLSHSYLGMADSYFQLKNYNKALINLLKSLDISNTLNLIEYQRDAYKLLSEIYENNNEYKKALESHQQFKKLNDSLFNKKNIEKIAQLEYEYQYKQALDSANIRELKLTKTVLTTSQDLTRTKQNYLWAIIGILVISILSGSFVFYQKYKTVKIMNQNIVTEQKLLRSQMTPHFIFNSLSVLQGMILNKEKKKSITYLSKFSKLLRIVLENSRDKVVPLIQELNAIENYMVLQNLDADPPYDYGLVVDENIDVNLFLVPPMLIQPFIENAIEHAFMAEQVNRELAVHLSFKNKELSCSITDNGIGIDAISKKTNTKKKSLATTITKERLLLLTKDFQMSGDISIEDRKIDNEQGTRVTLVIPYQLNDKT